MKQSNYYLGIDPGGVSGAFAFAGEHDESHSLPIHGEGKDKIINFKELHDNLKLFNGEIAHCIIELVHSMPKQGVASTFKFGGGYYGIQAVISILEIPYSFVTPQMWKKHFQIKRGSTKEASRQTAQRLFPAVDLSKKKDSDRAEALLIARYCQDIYG